MAQTKELKPDEKPPRQVATPPGNRVLWAIIGIAASWLLAMTGSIWWSAVPQAGWKATVLLGIGSLFIGGWIFAVWLRTGRK